MNTMCPDDIIHGIQFISDYCSMKEYNMSEEITSQNIKCSFLHNVKIRAAIQRNNCPDHSPPSKKLNTLMPKCRIIPRTMFSPEDILSIFLKPDSSMKNKQVTPLASYTSQLLLFPSSAVSTVEDEHISSIVSNTQAVRLRAQNPTRYNRFALKLRYQDPCGSVALSYLCVCVWQYMISLNINKK